MLVGDFQKVVYGFQYVHVRTITRQHTIIGYGYPTSALFVEVLFVPIGLGLEKVVPIVVHDEFQQPHTAQFFLFPAVIWDELEIIGTGIIIPPAYLYLENLLKGFQRKGKQVELWCLYL